MDYITVDNKIITTPIIDILKTVRNEISSLYLRDIRDKGDEISITCPYHKDGNEKHPSCFVHCANDDNYGVFHCFTCGSSGTIIDLIAKCFNQDNDFAKEWLIERFGDYFLVRQEVLPEIVINDKEEKKILDESILDNYKYFHPYMFERGLTEEIIRKFSIGCTPDGKYITFPFWDEHGDLIGIFERSTVGKEFIIPKEIKKPIYLLNEIIKNNITTVCVCEGLFDTLIMWVYGYPAIGLCGAGTSKNQMEILNKTGIRNYILMYDSDEAGRKGADRFKNMIRKDVLVTDIIMPIGKDCASCSKDEIDHLLKNS